MKTRKSFEEVLENLPVRQKSAILRLMGIEGLDPKTKLVIASALAITFSEIYTQNQKVEELTTKLEKLRIAHNACATEKVSQ